MRQVRGVVTEQALAELNAMSAASVDRYLKPARDRMRIYGISTTKPSTLLRTSITIHTCADETPDRPGAIEADTVAHCGPTLISELARHGQRWADHLRPAPTQFSGLARLIHTSVLKIFLKMRPVTELGEHVPG